MQSSNPFENSNSSSSGGKEDIKEDFVLLNKEDPTIQSTLIKRLDSIQQQDHIKKKQDLLDTKSNESNSICGASPFEVPKEDHSYLKSANTLKEQKEKEKPKQQENQQSINESISLPFSNNIESTVSLEKQQSTEIVANSNNNNDQFVSVPFSPPLKPFSLEKQESNSELPYIRPDNFDSTNYPHSTTTTNTGLLNPGIDRTYYNMNSRIGGNIPLDDDNLSNNNPFPRVTTAVDPEVEVNNDDDEDEAGPMVNININPGTFAEPNGAEVPVVTRRRRNDDKIGVIVMCTIILIIIGACIAFLFI
ncbi:hypothetical protein RB653_004353 [Dictyostelium firmibasis]|uniref:Uncharacterized protein n=1 Tax=Dictyostelium firmibasis TaxID=79012 RepID=A0AAN7U0T9_9MYCE